MADIKELKITEDKTRGKHVADLPVNPTENGMSAQELQGQFDALPEMVIAAFNTLLDYLVANGAGDKITPATIGAIALGKELKNEDLNTVLDEGFYFARNGHTCKSLPVDDNYFFGMQVVRIGFSNNYSKQIVYKSDGSIHYRNCNVGGVNNTKWTTHFLPLDGTMAMQKRIEFQSIGATPTDGSWVGGNNKSATLGVANAEKTNTRDLSVLLKWSSGADVELSSAIRANLDGNAYNIFGEHNKPDGFYTGNGSAEERFISVGGIGGEHKALLIGSTNGFALVFGIYGSLVKNVETLRALKAAEAQTTSAQSLRLKTIDACLNQNGVQYYYKNI